MNKITIGYPESAPSPRTIFELDDQGSICLLDPATNNTYKDNIDGNCITIYNRLIEYLQSMDNGIISFPTVLGNRILVKMEIVPYGEIYTLRLKVKVKDEFFEGYIFSLDTSEYVFKVTINDVLVQSNDDSTNQTVYE